MNFFINAAGDKPMYEQVKDGIKEAILSGELKAHDLMPSVRQLAADLNVSMITTKRAYADLERDGLIYTVAGKGTFVKSEDLEMIRKKNVDPELTRTNKCGRGSQAVQKAGGGAEKAERTAGNSLRRIKINLRR